MTAISLPLNLQLNSPNVLPPIPQESDYVSIPFRLLSATIVGSGTWKSTSFENEDVLKASIPMLEGKPAFTNHEIWDVQGAIGTIQNVRWEDSFTDDKGNVIPPGIVGEYIIDGKQYPDLVRKLVGVPEAGIMPAVNGSSVTVRYMYVPSHDFQGPDAEWQFERNIGTVIDGKEVTRVVTEIVEYRESSIVNFPADKFARNRMGKEPKKQSGGGMMSATLSLSEESDDVRQVYQEGSYQVDLDEMPVQVVTTKAQKQDNPTENTTQANESDALVIQLKAQIEDAKKDSDAQKVVMHRNQKTIENLQANTVSLAKQVADLQTQLTAYKEKVSGLEPRAILGDAYLIETRKEVKRLYGLSAKDDINDNMLKIFDEADIDSLQAFKQEYAKKAEEAHALTCKKCGGKDVSRQSSNEDAGKPDVNMFDELRKNALYNL